MSEIAHWSGLAPIVWLGLLWFATRRRASWAYWIVAAGFAVSWVVEFFPIFQDGSWALTAYFPAVQFGLFASAFGGVGVACALPVVALIQQVLLPGPDFLATVVGSVGTVILAWNHSLNLSMLAYCLLGSACAVLMIANVDDRPAFDFWWLPYQGARLSAFALFIQAAHREASRA